MTNPRGVFSLKGHFLLKPVSVSRLLLSATGSVNTMPLGNAVGRVNEGSSLVSGHTLPGIQTSRLSPFLNFLSRSFKFLHFDSFKVKTPPLSLSVSFFSRFISVSCPSPRLFSLFSPFFFVFFSSPSLSLSHLESKFSTFIRWCRCNQSFPVKPAGDIQTTTVKRL